MYRNAPTMLVAAMLCSVSPVVACSENSTFPCPDDKAIELLEQAVQARIGASSFSDSIAAFSSVIENATRPMDNAALRRACSGLAHDSYLEDHGGHGADHFGLIPPKEAVGTLRQKYPIVAKCPDRSLYQILHPVQVTGSYRPPQEAVRLGITGWVDLELDVSDDGTVESARIVDSSNSIFESGIVDRVLQYRYPGRWHYMGRDMRRKGFQLRVTTDYFHIAREKGCDWSDPRTN